MDPYPVLHGVLRRPRRHVHDQSATLNDSNVRQMTSKQIADWLEHEAIDELLLDTA